VPSATRAVARWTRNNGRATALQPPSLRVCATAGRRCGGSRYARTAAAQRQRCKNVPYSRTDMGQLTRDVSGSYTREIPSISASSPSKVRVLGSLLGSVVQHSAGTDWRARIRGGGIDYEVVENSGVGPCCWRVRRRPGSGQGLGPAQPVEVCGGTRPRIARRLCCSREVAYAAQQQRCVHGAAVAGTLADGPNRQFNQQSAAGVAGRRVPGQCAGDCPN
jgi:hypothetical protein